MYTHKSKIDIGPDGHMLGIIRFTLAHLCMVRMEITAILT